MSDALLDLAVLERKKFNYLNETLDLTRQLGDALGRSDQESVRMVVAMRQEPILHLAEVDRIAKERRDSLPPEERQRLEELQQGAAAESASEKTFLEQSSQARRLLERVVELDRRISLRMAGDQSFYKK